MSKQASCQERIEQEYAHTIETVRLLWEAYCQGEEQGVEGLGEWTEYGLSFDYVASDEDNEHSYFQWCLSTGGPGDEVRFYPNIYMTYPHIEYVFLDWFDGAEMEVSGADKQLLTDIWDNWFIEGGQVAALGLEPVEVW